MTFSSVVRALRQLANLQRFGMEKIGKAESLQEIIAEMAETTESIETASADCPPS